MGGGSGKKTWWVYMLACRGGKIYTGTAIDPEARFLAHREGEGAAFTRANPPVALLRCEPCESRGTACRAESALKKLPRKQKVAWARGEYSLPEGINAASSPIRLKPMDSHAAGGDE